MTISLEKSKMSKIRSFITTNKMMLMSCGLTVLVIGTIILQPNIREEQVVRVERVERVVAPIPSTRTYPSLTDPKLACSGAPVKIVWMEAQRMKEDNWVTFFSVRPLGDEYEVPCQIDGFYGETWKVGDIISIPEGSVSG